MGMGWRIGNLGISFCKDNDMNERYKLCVPIVDGIQYYEITDSLKNIPLATIYKNTPCSEDLAKLILNICRGNLNP